MCRCNCLHSIVALIVPLATVVHIFGLVVCGNRLRVIVSRIAPLSSSIQFFVAPFVLPISLILVEERRDHRQRLQPNARAKLREPREKYSCRWG